MQRKQSANVIDGKASRHPQNDGNPFTVKGMPTAEWAVDKLTKYAKQQAEHIAALGKKVAIHTFRLGAALAEAKKKPELRRHGAWGKFLKSVGISGATAWRAEELFKLARSEENVAGLEITEAYIKFGIMRQKGGEKVEKTQRIEARSTAKANKASTEQVVVTANKEPAIDPESQKPKATNKPVGSAAATVDNKPESSFDHRITKADFEAITAFVEAVGGWERAKWVLIEGERKCAENKIG